PRPRRVRPLAREVMTERDGSPGSASRRRPLDRRPGGRGPALPAALGRVPAPGGTAARALPRQRPGPPDPGPLLLPDRRPVRVAVGPRGPRGRLRLAAPA